jgi:hypothetical protein
LTKLIMEVPERFGHPTRYIVACNRDVVCYVGNHLLGWMKTRGATDSTCLFFLSSCFLLGGAILGFVKTKKQAVAASTHAD